jgi:hypothetical protein
MKPAWDKLMEEFADSSTSLVADVDCTDDSTKALCETHGVQGFPTIKHGDPDDMKSYEGGRDFDSLKAFAEENLGPQCGPDHMDLCDDKKRKKIEQYQALSADDLKKKMDELKVKVEVDIPLMQKTMGYLKSQKTEM